jgi:hypothetical protein
MKFGQRFAKDLAGKLELHACSKGAVARTEERRVLGLIDRMKPSRTNPQMVSILTQAVELHVRTHGHSQALNDAMFKLFDESTKDVEQPAPPKTESKRRADRPLMVPFRAGTTGRVKC